MLAVVAVQSLPGLPPWLMAAALFIGLILWAPQSVRTPRARVVLCAALLAFALASVGYAFVAPDPCANPDLPAWMWYAMGCWIH